MVCSKSPLLGKCNGERLLFKIDAGSPDGSRQYRFDDVARDVSETEVATLEFVDQFFVIDAHEVQHRGVEIVYVHTAIENVVAIFISEAMSDARFDPRTCQPDAEAARMVIATVIVR